MKANNKLNRIYRGLLVAVLCLLPFMGCDGVYSDVYDEIADAVFEGTAQWARSATTNVHQSEFSAVAVGKDGIYAVGYIYQTSVFNFGNGVTAQGGSSKYNPVVIKYDSKGNSIWARTSTATTGQTCYLNSVVTGKDGIYAVGSVNSGNYNFGNGQIITITNDQQVLLIKYDKDGNFQWYRTNTNSSNDTASFNSVIIGRDGIYVAGCINGTGQHKFGNIEATWITGVQTYSNAVIVKYDFNGSAVWAKTITAYESYEINSSSFLGISTGSDGIYAVGTISEGGNSSIRDFYNFGNSVVAEAVSINYTNLVIVKYDLDGNALWAKSVSGPGIGASDFQSVSTYNDEVYAAGCVSSTMTYSFGNSVSLTGGTPGDLSSIIVKYNSDGTTLWAKTVSSPSGTRSAYKEVFATNDGAYTVGNIYSTGTFDFGNTITLKGGYSSKVYPSLVKYDSNGNAVWARTASGAVNNNLFFNTIAVGSEGIYAAGNIPNNGSDFFDFGGISSPITGGYTSGNNALLVKYK